MKSIKLIVEGKEFNIEMQDSEFQELLARKNRTGYERIPKDQNYYYITSDADVCEYVEDGSNNGEGSRDYISANYHSSRVVAENNARADKLMRQLRRYAVEHRREKLDWRNKNQKKWCISFYNEDYEELESVITTEVMHPFSIYFDSQEICELAILQYRDELIWYFTEYKDSL